MTPEYRGEPLQHVAARLRLAIVQMIGPENRGHFGGSLSCADILTALYFHALRIDPADSGAPGRDRFVLSKGHASPALYAALALRGFFAVTELATLKNLGTRLQGHPDRAKLPFVDANTGSLGQGLSQAAGMALALRTDAPDARVFALLGDGELNEGQVWEAAMFAGAKALGNLIAIVDRNGLQAMGPTCQRLPYGDPRAMFASFGWDAREVDGHDTEALCTALDQSRNGTGRPQVFIARTIKGKGVACAENVVGFHNGLLTHQQYEQTVAMLLQQTGGER